MAVLEIPDGDESPHPVVMRTCTKCAQVKSETEYYEKKKGTGIYVSQCKKCTCAERKAYIAANPDKRSHLKPEIRERKRLYCLDYYQKNLEQERERGRDKYQETKPQVRAYAKKRYYENQEQEIARTVKWREENPEKVKAWVENNRPKINEATRRSRKKHPETSKASRDARRARKAGAKIKRLTNGYRDRLSAWQKGVCVYCKVDLASVKVHVDHLIPLKHGGMHAEENLQLLCVRCNLRKQSKMPMDFAAEMGIVKHPTLIPI